MTKGAELDSRRHPFRDDLAARYLEGRVAAAGFADPVRRRVATETLGVRETPADDATQISELLFGEDVDVYESREGCAWVQGARDGYVGYVRADGLTAERPALTHVVSARLSHLFPSPSIKAPPAGRVTLGARLSVTATGGGFARLADGRFIVERHIRPIHEAAEDIVEVALAFLGAPYLWGGRSSLGLDCSGLVQVAAQAVGAEPPRDTDMQAAELGRPVAVPAGPEGLARGDIVYFPGHCMIADGAGNLVHANAFHMAVTVEPTDTVFGRTKGGWSVVTAVRRL